MSFIVKSIISYFAFPTWNLDREDFEDVLVDHLKMLHQKIPYLVFEHKHPRAVIIYSHGNLETIFDICEFLKTLSVVLECTVISYDYPGYGLYRNHQPSEQTIYDDALAMYDHVLGKYAQGKSENMIIIGRSIGSAPAVYTAFHKKNIRSLVLISPFTSILGTMVSRIHFPFDMFKNYSYIPYINTPTLFIHGKKDKVVPYKNSVDLHKCTKNPESKILLFTFGTHNNLLSPGTSTFDTIIEEIQNFV